MILLIFYFPKKSIRIDIDADSERPQSQRRTARAVD